MCLPHPPGHEGRAGMAALALRPPQALDLVQLCAHVSENLPPYARPRFLRLQVTGYFRPSRGSYPQQKPCAGHSVKTQGFPATQMRLILLFILCVPVWVGGWVCACLPVCVCLPTCVCGRHPQLSPLDRVSQGLVGSPVRPGWLAGGSWGGSGLCLHLAFSQ